MYILSKTLLHTLLLLILKIIESLQCILKNCFLVVTNFKAILFIGFSIDLSNMAWFFNLAFCFLILLLSCSASFRKSVLRSIYGFKNGYCLNSNPVDIYLLKFNNRNTRTRCEICSKSLLLTLNIFHILF